MPRTRSAKGKKLEALSQDDFDNAVKQNRNAARDFIDNEKAPDQQTFWYYDRLKKTEKPLCVQTCEDGSIDYGIVPKDTESVEPFENIVVKVPKGTLWEPFLKNDQGT